MDQRSGSAQVTGGSKVIDPLRQRECIVDSEWPDLEAHPRSVLVSAAFRDQLSDWRYWWLCVPESSACTEATSEIGARQSAADGRFGLPFPRPNLGREGRQQRLGGLADDLRTFGTVARHRLLF